MKLCFVLLIAFVLGLTGCVHDPFGTPYSARIQNVGPQGVGMQIMMKVTNPNSFDVKVRNVRANVVLAGRFRMPPIVYNPDQWLRADGTTMVPVNVTVPWPMVAPLLATTVGSSVIDYRCTGAADVTAVRMVGIRVNDERFDIEGEVSRGQLVMMAQRGMGPRLPIR